MSCLGIRSAFPPSGNVRSAFRRPRLVVPSELKVCGGEVVGCSHGWVAVFNKRNDHLFLSDPLSNHRINLPSIRTLPDPHLNLDLDGHGSVSKVALSSSPVDDDCRAMMIFGQTRRLAFCSPRRSSEWTPIGDTFFHLNFEDHEEDPYEIRARVHADIVYCSKRKVFTAVTTGDINLRRLVDDGLITFENGEHVFLTDSGLGDGRFSLRYDWDVEDPYCPRLVRTFEMRRGVGDTEGEDTIDWVERNIEVLEKECVQIPHLVYAEDKDELFVAVQFVRLMNENEKEDDRPLGFVPRCEYRGLRGVFPCKTYGFFVMKMNDGGKRIGFSVLDEEDMNGMAMFVGINHSSFVIHEDEFQFKCQFKPNSIYFSDAKRIKKVNGANDCGVFDYATKIVSPFDHAPAHNQTSFWFT